MHSEELIDGTVGKVARLRIVGDPAAENLEAVPNAGDRISDLVRELCEQARRRREPVSLDELGLEHTEPRLPVLEESPPYAPSLRLVASLAPRARLLLFIGDDEAPMSGALI